MNPAFHEVDTVDKADRWLSRPCAEKPDTPAHEVYGYRTGCRMALMIGAVVATRRTGKTLESSRELRAQAIDAKHAAQQRGFTNA